MFLRTVGAGAGLFAGGRLLAACGDDDGTSTTSVQSTSGATTTGGATSAPTTAAATSAPASSAAPSAASTTGAAATTSGGTGTLDKVGFQLGWLKSVQYAGTFICQEKGYYTDENLEVEVFPGGPNNPVDPTIVSGQALIGVGATDYAARANAEGAGYRIIGTKNQAHAFCITSLADKPVENPKALESGVRLGVATINQPVIDAIVTLNGLDASKLNIVPTQGDPAPLANGEVDAFLTLFTSGPIALELQGMPTHSFLLADYGYNIFSGVMMVLEKSMEEKHEEITRLLRAEIKGWQDFVSDIQYATDITVQKYAADQNLDPAQQLKQAEAQLSLLVTQDTKDHGLFWMTDEKIQDNIATMKLLGTEIDESLFVRDFLEEIYQGGNRVE
jgi:NitT/TauT family transport system substrate-binding protein